MFENTENLARKLLQIQDNKYGKIGDLQLQKLFLTYCDLRKKEFLHFTLCCSSGQSTVLLVKNKIPLNTRIS